MLAIPLKRTDSKLVEYLTRDEMQAILDAPDPRTRLGIRDRAMFHMAFAGGLRVSELVGLCIDDLTFPPKPCLFVRGKDISELILGTNCGGSDTLSGITANPALGAVLKGGSSPIQQVINYAEKPPKKGLIIMDGPAVDAAVNTGMIAAGAQVIAFTTGRGTPLGSPIVPVIKISSHSRIYEHMKDNFDIDAGEILEGKKTISGLGEQILKEIIAVASEKPTRAEILGHTEFAIPVLGFTV